MNAGFVDYGSFDIKEKLSNLCALRKIDNSQLSKDLGLNLDSLHNNSITFNELEKITDYFFITNEEFLFSDIDKNWVSNPLIDKRYLCSEGSTLRTSIAPLEFISSQAGDKFLKLICKKVRFNYSGALNLDSNVRITLLNNILDECEKYGLNKYDFFGMGCYITKLKCNKKLLQPFQSVKKPVEILELLFSEYMPQYEKNFDYQVEKKNLNSILVKVQTKKERIEDFSSNAIANKSVTYLRQGGLYSYIKKFSGIKTSWQTLRSVHENDRYDLYELKTS